MRLAAAAPVLGLVLLATPVEPQASITLRARHGIKMLLTSRTLAA